MSEDVASEEPLVSISAILKVGSADPEGPWHFDRGSTKFGAKLVVYAADFGESHLAVGCMNSQANQIINS